MRATRLTIVAGLLVGLGCRATVRNPGPHDADGRVVGAELLGVRGVDEVVWLERTTPKGGRIHSVSFHNKATHVLASTDVLRQEWVGAMQARHGWRPMPRIGEPHAPSATFRVDDEIHLHVTTPNALAVYAAADVRAVMGDDHVSLAELVFVDAPTVGPIYYVADHVILEVGDGDLRSLRFLELTPARGALDNLAAIRRLRAGDTTGAAALLERAIQRDPRSGDSLYNLACVHAILGDLDRAEAELAIAIALDERRFSALARRDDDLAVLRERPSVERLIGD